MLTAESGLPLIRYNTRDQGGLLEHKDVLDLFEASKTKIPASAHPQNWQLPFVYLYGRKDLSLTFYALNIYVENIKHCLESFVLAAQFSGLFVMRVGHTENFDQRFEIVVETARGVMPQPKIASKLGEHIVHTLRTVNSEYAKLYSSIGERALPHVEIVPFGSVETVPGRKHRWVKRS